MSDYITRERNLTLLTDYYEYTMVNGYFHAGIQEKIAVFDVFFPPCAGKRWLCHLCRPAADHRTY